MEKEFKLEAVKVGIEIPEFKLSEKIRRPDVLLPLMISVGNIKEFVRLLKEEYKFGLSKEEFFRKIDELTGDLKWNKNHGKKKERYVSYEKKKESLVQFRWYWER